MQASRFACTRSEYCKGFGNSLRSATVNSPTRSTPPPKEPAGSNARAIHGNVLNFGMFTQLRLDQQQILLIKSQLVHR
eukprot:865069-Pelagomonas_calceolata.AAC.1